MKFGSKGEKLSATALARVRKGTLLNGDLYRRLLDCSQVSDVAHILKSTYYADYLPSDVESFHRDKFEFLLINVLNSEAQSFFSPVGLERRAFLKMWLEEQDIQAIKNKIWEIYAGKIVSDTEDEIDKDLLSLNYSLCDKQKLFSSNRIDEVIDSIHNTHLVTNIEEAVKRSVGGTSPALMMGFALDMFQNNRLFEAAKSFSGEEKDALLFLIGTYLDVMNITIIYRGKKYFKMPDEITLSILYSRYRVNFDTLKIIASLPPDRMWEQLAGGRYASLLQTGGEKDETINVVGITRSMRRIQRESALRVFLSGGAGVHFVLAYLMLRELEIMDISAIIEIVRYNYDRNRAEKLLAYPLEER